MLDAEYFGRMDAMTFALEQGLSWSDPAGRTRPGPSMENSRPHTQCTDRLAKQGNNGTNRLQPVRDASKMRHSGPRLRRE